MIHTLLRSAQRDHALAIALEQAITTMEAATGHSPTLETLLVSEGVVL